MMGSQMKHGAIFILTLFALLVGFSYVSNDTEMNNYLRRLQYSRTVDPEFEAVSLTRRSQAIAPAIVSVVTEHTSIDDLCLSMTTLVNAQGSLTAPVFIFSFLQDSILTEEGRELLTRCTDRSVYYPIIDKESYPKGFVPKPGVDYTHAQENRFWTTLIWEDPVMAPYDVIMKLDQDTCFSRPSSHLPDLEKAVHNYHSQYFANSHELNPYRLLSMHKFAVEYLKENNLFPIHVELWQRIKYNLEEVGTLPVFHDAFEVSRKSFMTRDDVSAWHYALTELPPYGYFNYGWCVHAERFLTAAIFGTPNSIQKSSIPGFIQKRLELGIRNHKVCTYPFRSASETSLP